MIEIVLPWPPKELFPNQANRRNGHFGYERKARSMRTLAWGLVAEKLGPQLRKYKPEGEIVLRYEFQPPVRKGPVADEDNVMAALKSARDGIASALGVNDRDFRHERPIWRGRCGDGKITISF